ncbi:MAG: exosortase system-associated protein, TIGR04073 family [Verrucomicrobiae bacterium]|nr:exosortase system-associated protein, TIGR04073 family [Verrucomicrobiae bacterium]MCX7721891.1 exosortase system-associated protein, TIGR04073 family [Verrucomicrobiae bacterium]MDW7979122.1 exosortase system-associated protein, TIGR04073 family [Verrucomicrobiales bacterium]
MRNRLFLIAAALVAGLGAAGCAGPEKKLGRGINNTLEIVRWGEMSRSIEQAALFESPRAGYTTGLVRGFNRTLARTGLGLYEIVTFPFPSYRPVWTNYLSPEPAYPDSYKPGRPSSQMLMTDVDLGFSGGDVFPWLPGSRFRIFENQ